LAHETPCHGVLQGVRRENLAGTPRKAKARFRLEDHGIDEAHAEALGDPLETRGGHARLVSEHGPREEHDAAPSAREAFDARRGVPAEWDFRAGDHEQTTTGERLFGVGASDFDAENLVVALFEPAAKLRETLGADVVERGFAVTRGETESRRFAARHAGDALAQ